MNENFYFSMFFMHESNSLFVASSYLESDWLCHKSGEKNAAHENENFQREKTYISVKFLINPNENIEEDGTFGSLIAIKLEKDFGLWILFLNCKLSYNLGAYLLWTVIYYLFFKEFDSLLDLNFIRNKVHNFRLKS